MSTFEDWTEQVRAELGLSPSSATDGVRDAVLDLARDVAHGVARPAAPFTAFLVGLAAGRSGALDEAGVRELVDRVVGLIGG